MASSYRFVVRGQVQGVGFRYVAVNQARTLGIAGWVRNRQDGCVEGFAAGSAAALAQFRDWLQRGPPAAKVTGLDWTADGGEPPGADFVIRP